MTNATEETFDGKGGLRIFLRSWTPESAPRAVVIICHGVNSHGGQYLWPAGELVKKGHAVFALDLRGRGKSDGERFYVDDIADYVADVAGVVKIAKARHPGLPVFLLGHSAGGVVSVIPCGCVLRAPFVERLHHFRAGQELLELVLRRRLSILQPRKCLPARLL